MIQPLTKPLYTPFPSTVTEITGICASDIIVRTAIVAAIADIRANPWLLQYAFASLAQDTLTLKDYGEKERKQAIDWFLRSEIKVMMGTRPPDGAPYAAAITVAPVSDDEDKVTLGDVHFQTREEVEAAAAPLTSRFDPVSYDALSGTMVVPDTIADALRIAAQTMAVVDVTGKAHLIEEVVQDNTFRIAEGSVADFRDAYLKPAIPPLVAGIESVIARQSFSIGAHAASEPVFLTYLFSILQFSLFRYRELLLEARGFGESTISGREIQVSMAEEGQPYYARYLTLSGNVRHSWPKAMSGRILSVDAQFSVEGGEHLPVPPGQDLEDQSWVGELDVDSLG